MTLKGQVIGQNKWHLDLKDIDLDTKIVILSVLVQKLWSKTSFCKMVDCVTCTSHVQAAQDIFNLLKSLSSTYFVLKFGAFCLLVAGIWPKM